MELTLKQFQAIAAQLPTSKATEYLPHLNKALEEGRVNTPQRICSFLGQCLHESGGLHYWHEIYGPTLQQLKYEPPNALAARLGNVQYGDGKLYLGRSPIQITGRTNYLHCGQALGLDLIKNPELIALPPDGFRAAIWFWVTHKLNQLADLDTEDAYKKITKAINGGTTGWESRVSWWLKARKALALPNPA